MQTGILAKGDTEMGNDGSTAMERNLFNLKFAAKELERSAKKCEKDAVGEKLKLKRAIEQGNMEGAQIYAENAIRNKNQVKCRDFFIS
jgi:charged multivesicular body protein 1